jgi:hypothetical protein
MSDTGNQVLVAKLICVQMTVHWQRNISTQRIMTSRVDTQYIEPNTKRLMGVADAGHQASKYQCGNMFTLERIPMLHMQLTSRIH